MKWTEEQIDILIKMTDEGYSAVLIGREIGKSADAVLSKRRRLWIAANLKARRSIIMKKKLICRKADCDRCVQTRGMCSLHYKAWLRHDRDKILTSLKPMTGRPDTCSEWGV